MKLLTIKNINENEMYPNSIINIGRIYPGNLYTVYFLFRSPFLKTGNYTDYRNFENKYSKWRKSTLFLIRFSPFDCTKSNVLSFVE